MAHKQFDLRWGTRQESLSSYQRLKKKLETQS